MKRPYYSSNSKNVNGSDSDLLIINLTGFIHWGINWSPHVSLPGRLKKANQNLSGFFLLVLITLLKSMTALSAQNSDIQVPLWDDDQLVFPEYDYVEKFDTNDIVRVQKVTHPFIEVYLPARKNRSDISVVICPGGGYGILAWDWEGQDFAKRLNAAGITAFVLKYRLPFPVNKETDDTMPMRDAMRAIQIVRHKAPDWELDPHKIGIMGFSAGGHLASSVGVHFDDQTFLEGVSDDTTSARPDFMALIYPVIDFGDHPDTHKGSRANLLGNDLSDQKKEYYSSQKQVTSDTPPAFLIHAQDDKAVPVGNSINMYKALTDKNVAAELHVYPHGGHGFGLALDKGRLSKWPELLIDWIKAWSGGR